MTTSQPQMLNLHLKFLFLSQRIINHTSPFLQKSRMLLHNNISPPFLHTLKTTTTTHPRNLTISSQQQQQPTTTTTLTGTGPKSIQGISISDKTLTTRGFNFHRSIENLDLNQLNNIFVAVGFPRRDTDKIRVALEHTDALLWVEYENKKKPIAFARATGDGVFNAIIWDVVVDPSFQGIGLGKALMERLMNILLEKGITNIALYSEPRVLGFYRPLGFVADPDGIRGMVYSRKKKNK